MDNIMKTLKKANNALDNKLKDLEQLEAEKLDILKRYAKANDEQRLEIENEMKASEVKFKLLLQDVNEISKKIDKLKKQYC
ncbi:MAG: hypothetical protein E7376_01045 [Clostridiales bacterium]|nr:hypothetical protein [Clostridiales bacterium]